MSASTFPLRRTLIIPIVGVFALAACGDDDDAPESEATATDLRRYDVAVLGRCHDGDVLG